MHPALLIILLAVALVALAGWVGYVLVSRRRARGTERLLHTLPVHSAWWRELARQDGDLLYVVVGDSAAQGIGASQPQRGYVGILNARISELTGRSTQVVNLSVSGARLREAIEVQLPRLAKLDADVLTVAIGANDIASFDPERFRREITTIVAALPAHAIIAEVPCFFFWPGEGRARQANRILHDAASARGLAVAPLHRRTRAQGPLLAALNQASEDFFHPNDRGYRVWASAFLPAIEHRCAELMSPAAADAAEPPAGAGHSV